MTRTYRFARPMGSSDCVLKDGQRVTLPVFAGILKHPHRDEISSLIQDEDVARKYTQLALQKAAWQVLREFPREWLAQCLDHVELREGRRRALRFLLGLDPSPFIL